MNKLASEPHLKEDLIQEALIHFWKQQKERPGQTLSWYLQSCSFHLRHVLNAGRSVDSRKRHALLECLAENTELPPQPNAGPQTESPVMSEVDTRDMLRLLSNRLNSRERIVLRYLADGMGPREIGRQLNLSHPIAIRTRRKIASVALQLGIRPGEASQTREMLPREGLGHRPQISQG